MNKYPTIDDLNLDEGQTVIVRVDFNSPIDPEKKILLGTTRIEAHIPTIKELIEKKLRVVLLAHQGRKGGKDFISLQPHAEVLNNLMKGWGKCEFIPDIVGNAAKNAIRSLQPGEVILLDNVRQLDDETAKKSPEEHAKSSTIVKELAPLADAFVNDAFSAAHRAHASTIGFIPILPSAMGRLMEKEVFGILKATENPERPVTYLLGGTKPEDTLPLIQHVLDSNKADHVLVGGTIAHVFHLAEGKSLSKPSEEFLEKSYSKEELASFNDQARQLLQQHSDKIVLPSDYAADDDGSRKNMAVADLPVNLPLLDIGDETIRTFKDILAKSKTVIINGPMGMFEKEPFAKGTVELLKTIGFSGAYSVGGGGHTLKALKVANTNLSFVSTAGGALLRMLSGKELAVLKVLREKHEKEK